MHRRTWALLVFCVVSLLLGWWESKPPRWMLEDPLRHPFALEFFRPDLPAIESEETKTEEVADEGPVPVNLADAQQLRALPGVGKVTAERILLLREEVGPFRHAEDLLAVRGIGPKTLEKMRPRLVFATAEADSD